MLSILRRRTRDEIAHGSGQSRPRFGVGALLASALVLSSGFAVAQAAPGDPGDDSQVVGERLVTDRHAGGAPPHALLMACLRLNDDERRGVTVVRATASSAQCDQILARYLASHDDQVDTTEDDVTAVDDDHTGDTDDDEYLIDDDTAEYRQLVALCLDAASGSAVETNAVRGAKKAQALAATSDQAADARRGVTVIEATYNELNCDQVLEGTVKSPPDVTHNPPFGVGSPRHQMCEQLSGRKIGFLYVHGKRVHCPEPTDTRTYLYCIYDDGTEESSVTGRLEPTEANSLFLEISRQAACPITETTTQTGVTPDPIEDPDPTADPELVTGSAAFNDFWAFLKTFTGVDFMSQLDSMSSDSATITQPGTGPVRGAATDTTATVTVRNGERRGLDPLSMSESNPSSVTGGGFDIRTLESP